MNKVETNFLPPEQKMTVLKRWQVDAKNLEVASSESMSGGLASRLAEISPAIVAPMNAEWAAKLAARLGADVSVPIHSHCQGSWFTDSFILSYDRTPERFVTALQTRATKTAGIVLNSGQIFRLVL